MLLQLAGQPAACQVHSALVLVGYVLDVGDRVLLWESATLLCSVNPGTLQPTSCVDFDPRDWQEAWWGTGFEATGETTAPNICGWASCSSYARAHHLPAS
jgi:hypothetical protein